MYFFVFHPNLFHVHSSYSLTRRAPNDHGYSGKDSTFFKNWMAHHSISRTGFSSLSVMMLPAAILFYLFIFLCCEDVNR